jgi:hypothetical protein
MNSSQKCLVIITVFPKFMNFRRFSAFLKLWFYLQISSVHVYFQSSILMAFIPEAEAHMNSI